MVGLVAVGLGLCMEEEEEEDVPGGSMMMKSVVCVMMMGLVFGRGRHPFFFLAPLCFFPFLLPSCSVGGDD